MPLLILWYIAYGVQILLAYGTAYRLTKKGGDNGISLWGWMFLLNLASAIPGLGFYLWSKYRDDNKIVDSGLGAEGYEIRYDRLTSRISELEKQIPDTKNCPYCSGSINKNSAFCQFCGGNVGDKE